MKIGRSWGVDRAIAYTLIGQGWRVLSGPINLIFIAAYLSPQEQGFFYTFSSILGLQIFFELGLGFVLLQFASHEKAKLTWTHEGILEGDATARMRLGSLLRQAMIWFGVVSVLMVLVTLPAGMLFFGRNQAAHGQAAHGQILWQLPWIWLVLAAAGNLLITPIFSVLEGCGLIAKIVLLQACMNISSSLLCWILLFQGAKLYAVPVSQSVGLLWGVGWLWTTKKAWLSDMALTGAGAKGKAEAIDWWREVWPFQWKIALMGVSGYLIFLLFNPVLFAFYGAEAAGRMGMSLAVTGALTSMASSWVNTKMAPFGALIAERQWHLLDDLFFPALWRSIVLFIGGGVALWLAAWYLHHSAHPWSRRILEPLPLALLIAACAVYLTIGAQAAYLRAHKQEPFLVTHAVMGVLTGLSTYVLGKNFGATGMMAGYLALGLVLGLGVGTWIFQQKRRLWHSDLRSGAEVEADFLNPAQNHAVAKDDAASCV